MRRARVLCLAMLFVLVAAAGRAEWALRVTASSFLDGHNGTSYPPENLIDGDASTPWIEGLKGEGVGDWIEVAFPEQVEVARLGLRNGCQYDAKAFIRNNRVRTARLVFSDRSEQAVELKDAPDLQYIYVKPTATTSVRLVIESVHWGYLLRNREHTCLSELSIDVQGRGEVTPPVTGRSAAAPVAPAGAPEPAPVAPVPGFEPPRPAGQAPAAAPLIPAIPAIPAAEAFAPSAPSAPAAPAAPVAPTPAQAAPPGQVASFDRPATSAFTQEARPSPAPVQLAAAPAAQPEPAPPPAAAAEPVLPASEPRETAPAPQAPDQPAPIKKGVLSAAKDVTPETARGVAALVRDFYTRLCTLDDGFPELFSKTVRDKEALAFEVFAQTQRQRGLYDKFRKARVSVDGLSIAVLTAGPDRAKVHVTGSYTVFLPETPPSPIVVRDFPEDVTFTLIREGEAWKVLERDDQPGG